MFASHNRASAFFLYTSNCQKCGKEFTQLTTQSRIDKNKQQKCCCSKCAHARVRTEEVKEKIGRSVRRYLSGEGKNTKSEIPNECANCSRNPRKYRSKSVIPQTCQFCGKKIFAKFEKYAYCYECAEARGLKNVQLWDENGNKIPSKAQRESSRKVQERLIKEGRHVGWKSRNIISFPEKFWKNVLDENGIKYHFNAPISKVSLGKEEKSFYFLDFLIGGNIDLEIDGKQHKIGERVESDRERDELLIKNGFYVYRVAWNDISSDEGSALMRQKVKRFLDWLGEYDKEERYKKDYEIPKRYKYICEVCGKEVKTNTKKRTKRFCCCQKCKQIARHLPRKR